MTPQEKLAKAFHQAAWVMKFAHATEFLVYVGMSRGVPEDALKMIRQVAESQRSEAETLFLRAKLAQRLMQM